MSTQISDIGGLESTLSRIREIQAMAQPEPTGPTQTVTTSGFAQQLATAQSATAAASTPGLDSLTADPNALTSMGLTGTTGLTGLTGTPGLTGATGTGQQIAAIASAELGVREQPPGSNNGTRIAEYRTATKGAGVGPWCSYFVSWVAAQAGTPIGPDGRGEGWVPNVERWGKDTGRWIAPNSGVSAQVGDAIIFDRNGDGLTDHIGIVTAVRPDGGVETVEGNSSDAVSKRSYGAGQWTGLVRIAPAA